MTIENVILAEKPDQARSYIEAFKKKTKKNGYYEVEDPILPSNTVVTYGFGHLVSLAEPELYNEKYKKWTLENLPIFPNQYKFVVSESKKKQFKIIKTLLEETKQIVVATDSDREGENIAWSIMTKAGIDLKKKTIKRLWINSLEKEAVLKGFKNLKNGWDFYSAYQEAQTRQISDWLVGMNSSRLYSLILKKRGIQGAFSIGRVQTPTLYMVYKRDQEIKNFRPEKYIELEGLFKTQEQSYKGKLEPLQRFKDKLSVFDFTTDKNVETGKQRGLIKSVRTEPKEILSPRLFSLSSLQSEVNKKYHASASDTLKAVQVLYESKLLTYPRTDCNFITTEEFNYLVENLENYKNLLEEKVTLKQLKAKKRYVDGSKVQEHHAIIMTKTTPTKEQLNSFSTLQRRVYELVLRNTLAMFAENYKYNQTTVLTEVGKLVFKTVGKTPTDIGWKALIRFEKKETDELPPVKEGQQVEADLEMIDKETTPPAAFTEGTLITAMKTAGKTLDDEQAQTILKSVEGIGTEATRANVLEVLKNRNYLVTQKNKLHVTGVGQILCEAVKTEPLLISPEMTAKWEMALNQIGQKQRTQNNFLDQIKKFVKKLLADVPKQVLQNKSLEGLEAEQKEKIAAEKELGVCPICKKGQVVDKGSFYGCSNYKTTEPCTFALPKKLSEKTLGKTAIKDLITKGETSMLKGFKSKKTGRSFSAKLKLEHGRLQFEFEDKKNK